MSTRVTINPNGTLTLSPEAWDMLLKASKVRSKKYRIQKKAVKREFVKALKAYTAKCPKNTQ